MQSKKQNIQHCKGCKYWRTLGMRGKTIAEAQFACHYLYDTGHLRGCPPEKCTRGEKNGRGNPPPEKK